MRIIMTIFIIFLIGLTSAIYSGENINLIAGQNYTWDFSDKATNVNNISIEVINNTYDLIGLNFIINPPYVTLKTDYRYKPDSFTIVFLLDGTNRVEEHIGGGGSSCRPNKDFNWNCSEWGDCIDGTKTRNCKEYNNCYNNYGRPNITANCLTLEEPVIIEPVIDDITITYPKSILKWYIIIIAIVLAFVLIMWQLIIIIKRRKEKE